MKHKATNPLDAETLKRHKMIDPVVRRDSAPLDSNPVRRFREELRLTRSEFAELLGTPLDTVKEWERPRAPVVPSLPRLLKLVEIARANHYPLLIQDIWAFSEKGDRRPRAPKKS